MKFFWLLALSSLCVSAEDIERIERIVRDVTELRQKYESCQEALSRIETAPMECDVSKAELLMRQKAQLSCEERLERLTSAQTQPCQASKSDALEAKIKALEEELKASTQRYTQLQTQYESLRMDHEGLKQQSVSAASKQETLSSSSVPFAWAEARAYRLLREADIYDAPGGKIVAHWEAQRSFTSMQGEGAWIRITGYFVNKQWRPSREESLWVRAEDAFRR